MSFQSRLSRYGSCAQVMPVPVIFKSALSLIPPRPICPLELPFHPKQKPYVDPAIVPIEIGEYLPSIKAVPGTILANVYGTVPDGYLLCNGQEVSRTTYALLFKLIGTYYGDGDLVNTFNVPNLSNDYNPNTTYIIKYD